MGNSAKLKATALVEAFNLRAAVELSLGNPAGECGPCKWAAAAVGTCSASPAPAPPRPPAGAAAALSDMPPRREHELDPVTLHNQALVALAQQAQQGRSGGSDPAAAAAAFDKLVHLLAHPPFPPELAGNLLSLCCRPEGPPSGAGPAESAAVAARLLHECGPLVAAHVPPQLLPLYEACVARARSPEEAHARLDGVAGTHIEGLRRGVKAVQDARWAGDAAGAAAGLQAYEAALDAYMPGGLIESGLLVLVLVLVCK